MLDTHNMTDLIRRVSWFTGFGIAVIVGTVGFLYVVQDRSLRGIADAREFARTVKRAAAAATDRETSIRGYLITRDQRSLLRNSIGKVQLPELFDTLATLAASDKTQTARVRAASAALARWDAEFATPAETGGTLNGNAVLAGKPLFDVVRARFGELMESGDARFARASSRARGLELAGALAVLVELLLFMGALLYLIRGRLVGQANDLSRQQELLEQQAVELELTMDETTSVNQSLTASLMKTQEQDTELRAAFERLRRSEELYRYVSKATDDAVFEWDMAANTVDWSDGMRDRFGYEEPGDSPEWITSLVHPEDEQRISSTFADALASGASTWRQSYRLRRADGKYSSVEGRTHILRGEDGAPTRVIGAITDRSQQQSLEEQLRQAQKMEAVGRLAGGIAHDFNNILTVIRMSSETLLSDLPVANECRHEATEIMKASDRASALTRQLLTFSRHQVLNPRIVVLNDVVSEIEGMVRRVVPENIVVRMELDPALDPIKADVGQLEQVILNLVINASDAMPAGGSLDVRTSNVDVDAAFIEAHLDMEAGRYVCLTVSDTGLGMDKETASRIFEPFFTTKPVGKGTGLGLATVHGIVTQAGGRVWVYSEPGHGTTFKIFIPRSGEVALAVIPREVVRFAPATETILLVEDESSTREAVRRSLTRAGYTVLLATNGVEALAIAASSSTAIDMVLTDSMMPEMGGLEMVVKLRATRPGILVLMMSGYTEQTTASRFGLSEQPFIEKPFATADLLAAVQRVLHSSRVLPAA